MLCRDEVTSRAAKAQRGLSMSGDLRARLLRGERLIGSIVSLPCTQVAEVMAAQGFDWLFVDAEHGPFALGEIVGILQAAKPCPCLVRVRDSEESSIKAVLDLGVAGVIVPMINSAEDAQRVVSCSRYPPQGRRSVGIARSSVYGRDFAGHLARANAEVAVIAQIEHVDAVSHIDEILSVEGIDGVFVGPYDLSASLGRPGETGHAEVLAGIERVRRAALEHGTPIGIFGMNAGAVSEFLGKGFTLIVVGIDTLFLGHAAHSALQGVAEVTVEVNKETE